MKKLHKRHYRLDKNLGIVLVTPDGKAVQLIQLLRVNCSKDFMTIAGNLFVKELNEHENKLKEERKKL